MWPKHRMRHKYDGYKSTFTQPAKPKGNGCLLWIWIFCLTIAFGMWGAVAVSTVNANRQAAAIEARRIYAAQVANVEARMTVFPKYHGKVRHRMATYTGYAPGETDVEGDYVETGTLNGKPKYVLNFNNNASWTGTYWRMTQSSYEMYTNSSGSSTLPLTGWVTNTDNAFNPPITFTLVGGGGGGDPPASNGMMLFF